MVSTLASFSIRWVLLCTLLGSWHDGKPVVELLSEALVCIDQSSLRLKTSSLRFPDSGFFCECRFYTPPLNKINLPVSLCLVLPHQPFA